MPPKHFTDPLGSKLPALERNLLKLRGLEMVLVIFYAEELKRRVIGMVQATDTFCGRAERVPKTAKNKTEKALQALVDDGAITIAEKKEIVESIDYRNKIAHHMHELVADLSPEAFARDALFYSPDRFRKYDYDAVERLQAVQRKLDCINSRYITELSMNALIFQAAEKTFLSEIEKLKTKISALAKVRKAETEALNKQFSLESSELVGEHDPFHPLNQYDNGRLTQRGVEICYRLFDMGKSPMAVAHMMRMRLSSMTARHRKWKALGQANRTKADVATLPRRKFYRRDDD